MAATRLKAPRELPVYTAKTVSKELPAVSMRAGPVSGAIQVHQTEAPGGLPAWLGSPGSAVAFSFPAARVFVLPVISCRPAKTSFGGACARYNAGRPAGLYFWRDNTGNEVDLLFETGTSLQPVEIKSGATFVPDWLRGLKKWASIAGDQTLPGWLV